MIISASRRTDIPAFYSDWFIKRLEEGFVCVRNPFNTNQISEVKLTPELVECIVFWTKNPKNMLPYLKIIDSLGYKYYFQFTLNSYEQTIEKNVSKKEEIIKVFKELSNIISAEKIIWRYDPILITNKFSMEYHLKWYGYLANKLSGYTTKCIISFMDMYKKCQNNMKNINLIELDINQKRVLAGKLSQIAQKYNLKIESCAENIDLKEQGINHGKCIDDKLISQIIGIPITVLKDKNQRKECGCIESIDIGAYNTCKHACKYCYANYSQKTVQKNISVYDVNSPLITGKLTGNEKITNRKIRLLKRRQPDLFDMSERG